MSALIIEEDNEDRRNKVRENKTLIKPRCEISFLRISLVHKRHCNPVINCDIGAL